MSGIDDVLARHGVDLESEWGKGLREALLNREDNMADILRLAGTQFGLYPQIVAEVLASAGLGTPMPDDERAMIRANFVALMEELQRQNREGN